MRECGYQTAWIGKWDVSDRQPILERMPSAQGFDEYFGPLGANDLGARHVHQNHTRVGSTRDMGSLIRMYTDKSIDYLENQRDPNKPFLRYLAHTMPYLFSDRSRPIASWLPPAESWHSPHIGYLSPRGC
jgi:arylsulfatase A-like enzyme